MVDTKCPPNPERGRPRRFDTGEAVAAATAVFCREGYEGASLSQLTRAMRINPPSFYAAFGSKEALFLEVLGQYHSRFEAWVRQLFDAPATTLAALSTLLSLTAQNHAAARPMQGCLIVNSTIYGCRRQAAIARRVGELAQRTEELICARLLRGQADGDVSATLDARKVACFVNGLIQAMAVTARVTQSPPAVGAIAEVGIEALTWLLRVDDGEAGAGR